MSTSKLPPCDHEFCPPTRCRLKSKFAIRHVAYPLVPKFAVTKMIRFGSEDIAWFFSRKEAEAYAAWRNGTKRLSRRR